jgi:hypothetical protein
MDVSRLVAEVCRQQGWHFDGSAVTVRLDNDRRQVVELTNFVFDGEDVTRLYTRVGPVSILSGTQLSALLGLNFSLAFGALASYGDDLVMTETLLLRESSLDQLAYAIRFLAEKSDGYEKQIYGTDHY